MQPSFARGNSRTLQRLKALRQEAQRDMRVTNHVWTVEELLSSASQP